MKLLHERDTMTSEERLRAAINLQVPDRVPCCPFIYYFAAYYAGITVHELWSEPKKYRMAIEKCLNDLGPWDVYYPVNPLYPELYTFIMPMKAKWPGRELSENNIHQLLEDEIILAEDYRWIGELNRKAPWFTYIPFYVKIIGRAWDDIGEGWRTYSFIMPKLVKQLAVWRYEFEMMKRKGVTTLYGFLPEAAFDTFSLGRGLTNFVRDLKERPEEVRKAAEDLTDGYVFACRLITAITGIPRVEIFVHRSSNDFLSPKTFNEISFPSLKALVERLVALGIRCVLHLDGNWDLNLETLRELPAGNVIAQFDGPTNIFLAKEVIGDRICIMGDVPADMFCLASTSEVDEYCHRLIEEVGTGGGYIMGAGCEIPPNARPENVKAMIDSVTKYGYYEKRALGRGSHPAGDDPRRVP